MRPLLRIAVFFILPCMGQWLLHDRYLPNLADSSDLLQLAFFALVGLWLTRNAPPVRAWQYLVFLSLAVSQTAVQYFLLRHGYALKFSTNLWDMRANYDGILSSALIPLSLRILSGLLAARL